MIKNSIKILSCLSMCFFTTNSTPNFTYIRAEKNKQMNEGVIV